MTEYVPAWSDTVSARSTDAGAIASVLRRKKRIEATAATGELVPAFAAKYKVPVSRRPLEREMDSTSTGLNPESANSPKIVTKRLVLGRVPPGTKARR